MGPILPVRAGVQGAVTPLLPGTGVQQGNGSRGVPAGVETARPVPPVAATARVEGGEAWQVEDARARAEAAERAYRMASLLAGQNPLTDPAP